MFSSGHRYWLDGLSDEENKKLFGKWASRFNHGHNYILEVTVQGKIDPSNGMVINIKSIDAILKDRVVREFDQKSLNDEVLEFFNIAATTENIALAIWRRIQDMPSQAKLTRIRLCETPNLFVDVTNGGSEVTLTRVYEFSASHRLHSPALSDAANVELFGKCNNPAGHGHNYQLEVAVGGKPDARTGMLADIERIDAIVSREVVDRYDHKHLNVDLPDFEGKNPTTEILTKTIFERLEKTLPVKLEKIIIRETARNFFEYSGEDE